jgi:type II secretory ATPase GspE/PulE/Tfp pilus assembly ATPase PilB-like protein
MIRTAMHTLLPCGALTLLVLSGQSAAAQEWPEYFVEPKADPHDMLRGPGFYLSMTKLILTAVILLVWVRLADWVHRDSQEYGERTKLPSEIWNSIVVFPFFVAFLFTISFPLFWLSYPLLVLSAIVPPVIYAVQRNGRLRPEEKVMTSAHMKRVMMRRPPPPPPPLPQDQGPSVEFKPAATVARDAQACLIIVRQNPAFPALKGLVADAIARRSDQILLDYSAEQVNVKYLVDGLWHDMAPMDRMTGDAMLHALKTLGSLNAEDRKSKQSATFGVSIPGRKFRMELLTQGVPTGERALVKFVAERKVKMSLHELGMLPEMQKRLRTHLNRPGLVIVSCMQGDGLTSSWNAVLESADRVVRDFVGLFPEGHTDTAVENIEKTTYDPKNNESSAAVLRTLMLKQPEAVVLPDPAAGTLFEPMVDQVLGEQRFLITRVTSKSSAEAILRASLNCDRTKLAKALTAVVHHRLIRRLCDHCKQPYAPAPALLQKLGVKPGTVDTLYREWQPPPPEERVDAKGRPIEIPVCGTCGGLGYVGRIAIFELLEANDAVRTAIAGQVKADVLQQVAKKAGNASLQDEGIKLVLAGITSLPELQRILKI